MGVCVHIQSRADSDDGNGMIAMVMMAMMIVLLMVVIVLEGLTQVYSVGQYSCQTFHKVRDFVWPKHPVQNFTPPEGCISQAQLPCVDLPLTYQAAFHGGFGAGFQAGYQAGFRVGPDKAFNCLQALQWTLYCYNSHVVNTDIHPSLSTSLILFHRHRCTPL